MAPFVRFPTSRAFADRHGSLAGPRAPSIPRRAPWFARPLVAAAIWSAIAVAAVCTHRYDGAGMVRRFFVGASAGRPATADTAAATTADALSAAFSFCGGGRRVNCVVDGDTFWFDGVKIRIADIDTPELSPPRCEAERIRGEAAKRRLLELLAAGRFSLAGGGRDEDRYGRKLRIVSRGGRSLGDVLVEEGLARRWDGARHPWCS